MWLLVLIALRYDVQENFKWSVSKAPSTRIRFCSKTEIFLRFGLLCTRVRWKLSLKTYLFDWTDENGGFRIRWCHSSLTIIITHALWGILSYFHCLPFTYGWAKKTRIRYLWMLFFKKKGKKSLFSKISGYVWTGPKSGKFVYYWVFMDNIQIVVKQKSNP